MDSVLPLHDDSREHLQPALRRLHLAVFILRFSLSEKTQVALVRRTERLLAVLSRLIGQVERGQALRLRERVRLRWLVQPLLRHGRLKPPASPDDPEVRELARLLWLRHPGWGYRRLLRLIGPKPKPARNLAKGVQVEAPMEEETRDLLQRGELPGAPTTMPRPTLPQRAKLREPTPPRVVNTGFSRRETPDQDLDPEQPLEVETPYYFWFEVGPLRAGSIEWTPATLPEILPSAALLTVAIFAFADGLRTTPGAESGRLRLLDSGGAEVVRQPGASADVKKDEAITRLLFPIATPARVGRCRLRCNVYYEHILLQSRLVAAQTGERPRRRRALHSTLDYRLSNRLAPLHLFQLEPQRLNLFLNQNEDGSHGFLFEGESDFKAESSLDAEALQDVITQARATLRRVAWGSSAEWQSTDAYRYARPPELKPFCEDLEQLAVRGYLLYHALIDGLSGGPERSDALSQLMRHPGRVQIASKESARMVLPASLLYDAPLDTQGSLRVCEAFLEALGGAAGLDAAPCLNGACPHTGELEVVCPGGFWGFRHELGLPVSLRKQAAGDVPVAIPYRDPASLAVIVSMDRRFLQRDQHEQRLQAIRRPLTWLLCDGRKQALATLRGGPHLVYFYCHGGVTATNTPFLSIGKDEFITPDNLRAYNIRWSTPRPLVFLNGCMTTALEPEQALEFVSTFVGNAHAAGVIGTEICVFEPLATRFAELFLQEFLGRGSALGTAMRSARLTLLKERNPLGLVYIPFALPSLRMVALPAA